MEPKAGDSHGSPRKRLATACLRCRRQKIKCAGTRPCDQCTKRGLTCYFDDAAQKVIVTRGYIHGLERRIASFEQRGQHVPASPGFSDGHVNHNLHSEPVGYDNDSRDAEDGATGAQQTVPHQPPTSNRESSPRQQAPSSLRSSPGPALMNPLAHGFTSYFADASGRPIYLGTSSNWSFGRRVLVMAHEKVMRTPLPPETLLFEGKSYDLGWDGARTFSPAPQPEAPALPSVDFATYLISAVKFHCGQLFHLFEEEKFMQQLSAFRDNPPTQAHQKPSLWYIHYLLILAFGKAFVAQSSKGRRPPGAEFFVHAMTLMPEFAFYSADPIEAIQVLCCAALYLHCLDFRAAAYRMIGQALRMALEHGMHTEMRSQQVDPDLAQRCRKVWWTVYVLDRQMSSLMGVPMGIADELISAELPTFAGQVERSTAMNIQIQLSRILAQILNTVYGPEGRLDKRFVTVTKESLKSVARVTDQLNGSFGILENGSQTAISRLSAYLHLLYHQCIVLTTRPLLFSFLRSRLEQSNANLAAMLKSSSVRMLLQMCVDSAQQMLTILSALQENGLLVSFLPFDLDAAFTSGIALLMAAKVNASLVKDPSPWLQRSYAVFQEMIYRGNMVAQMTKSELEQLEGILNRVSSTGEDPHSHSHYHQTGRVGRSGAGPRASLAQDEREFLSSGPSQSHLSELHPPPPYMPPSEQPASDEYGMDELHWQDGLSAEQLVNFAESMDLSALDWLSVDTDL